MNNKAQPVSITDHDLLIRVDEKLNQLSFDVKDLKDNTQDRLGIAEKRIDVLEKALVLIQGKTSGIDSSWGFAVQLLTLLLGSATMITLILHLMGMIK